LVGCQVFPMPFPQRVLQAAPAHRPPNPASWGFFCGRQNPSFGAPGHPRKQIGTSHSNAARLKKRRAALVQPREGNAKSRLSLVSISRAKVSCRIARGPDFRAQLKPALWCFVFAGRRGRGQEHYYAWTPVRAPRWNLSNSGKSGNCLLKLPLPIDG